MTCEPVIGERQAPLTGLVIRPRFARCARLLKIAEPVVSEAANTRAVGFLRVKRQDVAEGCRRFRIAACEIQCLSESVMAFGVERIQYDGTAGSGDARIGTTRQHGKPPVTAD